LVILFFASKCYNYKHLKAYSLGPKYAVKIHDILEQQQQQIGSRSTATIGTANSTDDDDVWDFVNIVA